MSGKGHKTQSNSRHGILNGDVESGDEETQNTRTKFVHAFLLNFWKSVHRGFDETFEPLNRTKSDLSFLDPEPCPWLRLDPAASSQSSFYLPSLFSLPAPPVSLPESLAVNESMLLYLLQTSRQLKRCWLYLRSWVYSGQRVKVKCLIQKKDFGSRWLKALNAKAKTKLNFPQKQNRKTGNR